MLVIVAGRTAPNLAAVFGGEHGDLDARGRDDIWGLRADLIPALSPGRPALRVGPESSVRQSAGLLGLHCIADPALASLDIGRWQGRSPEQVPGAELGEWFGDPAARPHGGESVAAFVPRIRGHVAGLPGDAVLVVAKPVAQALLCDDADSFFRTDIRPASMHRMP